MKRLHDPCGRRHEIKNDSWDSYRCDPKHPHYWTTDTGMEGRCGVCGGDRFIELHLPEKASSGPERSD